MGGVKSFGILTPRNLGLVLQKTRQHLKTLPTFFFFFAAFGLNCNITQASPIFTSSFGGTGTGPGEFNGAAGLLLQSGTNNIWVVDTNNNRVQVFNQQQNFLFTFGTLGTGDGQFQFPLDVSQNSAGNIMVTDSQNSRVQVFTTQGAYLSQFGTPGTGNGQFNFPIGINPLPGGRIIVADSDNNRMQVLTTQGSYLSQFGTLGTGDGQFTFPEGVIFSPTSGNIIVTDSGNNRVQVFDSQGTYLTQFGSPGTGPTQFNNPTFMSIQSATQHLYIADDGNDRVQVFDLRPFTPTYLSEFAVPSAGEVYVQPTSGKIYVTSFLGNQVQVFFDPREWTSPGTSQLVSLPLNQALTLGNGFNLQVFGNTSLNVGGDLSITPGGTLPTGSFTTGSLTFDGGSITDTANTILSTPVTLGAGGGTVMSGANNTLTFSGNIGGAGGLTMGGLGTTSLSGNNAYSGSTTVGQGTLLLNGNLTNSLVSVASGATIRGAGIVNGLNLGGTIAPGNPLGTLAVGNNYNMVSTALYQADIDPSGASDLIDVGGTATLAGTLQVIGTNRTLLKGQTFTILTAGGGVNGTFSTLLTTNRIKYNVRYLPNAVLVEVGAFQNFADAFGPTNTSNPALTARYFDTFADTVPPTSDLGGIIQILDDMLEAGDVAGLTNAFDQIQPSQYREMGMLSFLNNELVVKTVQSQQQYLRETQRLEGELRKLAGVSPTRVSSFYKLVNDTLSKGFNVARIRENTVRPKGTFLSFFAPHGAEGSGMPGNQRIRLGCSSAWFQSYGQLHEKNSSNGNVGLRSQTGGFSLGADHEIVKDTFVGLFGGLSTTPFDWKNGRGHGQMKSYYGGLYGTWMSPTGSYVDAQILAGQDHYRSNRRILFSTINRTAKESHHGNQFSVDTEIGYAYEMPTMTVQPYLGASYMLVHENGYTEKNANSLNFVIKSKTSQFARGTVGTQLYRTFVCGETLFRPALQLAFVRTQPVGSHRANINGGLVDEPQTLTVLGDNKSRNQFAPGLSLTAQFAGGAYVIANVSGQVFSGQNAGEALLRIGYDF